MNLYAKKSIPKATFFDLKRAAIVRESPSVRLRLAAIQGNLAAVKRLAKMTPDIQNPDPENGYTTLMLATRYGHVELVNWLLDAGHEEEMISMDNQGVTVLMLAILYNHEEIFYSYISRYPEVIHAISRDGCSALLVAAQKGNANLVGSLLSISADIDHTDNEGNSALHYAAAWGHPKVMELLISQGCHVDLQNHSHFTAADYAYSLAIKDHLRELSNMSFDLDSTMSLPTTHGHRQYPMSSTSSLGLHPPYNTSGPMITRTTSHGTSGLDSPVPRASTSSSSIPIPNLFAESLGSTGSHYMYSGSSPSLQDMSSVKTR
ncbi:ankyrin [Hesseltinella vesiculosa]|uniref:Ankyrin n=1 Tax=Hesseltinella vesiculosa TaxID=101127 RepID=A0A1X2G3X3_9FUNG|nr:ankyrin [Hesseltinella vesiculosa]